MKNFIDLWLGAFKNYVGFKGRARRKEFWTFYIMNIVAIYVMVLLFTAFGYFGTGLLISWFFWIAILLPTLAVVFRRIQDTGRSGWFFLVPVFNVILMFLPGTAGENKFGPDPRQ